MKIEKEHKKKHYASAYTDWIKPVASHWKDEKWENVRTACLSNARSVHVLHPPAVTLVILINRGHKKKTDRRPVMSSNHF